MASHERTEADLIAEHDTMREREEYEEQARRDGDPERYRAELMIDAYDAGYFDED